MEEERDRRNTALSTTENTTSDFRTLNTYRKDFKYEKEMAKGKIKPFPTRKYELYRDREKKPGAAGQAVK